MENWYPLALYSMTHSLGRNYYLTIEITIILATLTKETLSIVFWDYLHFAIGAISILQIGKLCDASIKVKKYTPLFGEII